MTIDLKREFFVPGTPRPQGSKRHIGGGRMIESSKHVARWRATVRQAAQLKCGDPLDGPVSLKLVFAMPRPKAMKPQDNPPMVQRPDADKLTRAVFDALSGIAYKDDSQVTVLHTWKRRARVGETSGVYITVSEAVAA